MNSNPINRTEATGRDPYSVDFGKFTAAVLVGHSIAMAVVVGVAGLALELPFRRLVVPYAMLGFCGLVLSPWLYWARLARARPKVCARRFVIAMFGYLQVLLVALGLSAMRLGILSATETISFAPFMVLSTALISIAGYPMWRQMLEAPNRASLQ